MFPPTSQAQNPLDAIALRILPNLEHHSALHWYQKQGFEGSPQSMQVDGYEAVRDGRTVYVNAANIDDRGTASPADDLLHTNIYLISYNQAAENVTQDIFGRMLKKWKFNTNKETPDFCNQTASIACLIPMKRTMMF
ncbi:hypothetical protein ACFLZ9_00595 [Patescibacteria group bacterium]